MLTNDQKRLLENKIYNLIKMHLTEKKTPIESKKYKDKDAMTAQKRATILKRLNDECVNDAQISYKVFKATTQTEKDTARSLFSKKRRGANGRKFTNRELNIIDSALDDINS